METLIKIAIVAFEVGVLKGYENVRSAHIQIPLKLYSLLKSKGEHVQLLTNKIKQDQTLPSELCGDVPFYIPDPRKRKNSPVMHAGMNNKISFLGVFKSLLKAASYLRRNEMEVVHLFGGVGVGIYASILKLILPKKIKVVWTTYHEFKVGNKILSWLLKRIDLGIANTDFVASSFLRAGISTEVIRHDVLRKFSLNENRKFRVTFWRDPSYKNGADIALEVFETLAEQYPDVMFTFMVRPHWDDIDLSSTYKNIEVHQYPYQDGVTIESVLSETIVCFFPFRSLSTNPQLCILETLQAGVPCVSSNIESVSEYYKDTDGLFELDKYANALDLLKFYLSNRDQSSQVEIVGIDSWENFLCAHQQSYMARD